ncbi:uncharacterized protein TNCV_1961701 [Trichonephila clavipes]|nr:uncharacterized protein TNCV_1961701 [Trichonephila clavipes]
MKRKENFQWLPKELHQLKYEAISVPQGSVRLVKKTQERKSSTCYLLITKGVTSSSPVPLKTRRERERHAFEDFQFGLQPIDGTAMLGYSLRNIENCNPRGKHRIQMKFNTHNDTDERFT